MSRSFEENLRTYAQVIVSHGLNIQKGQNLRIGGEPIHRDLAIIVAEEAYKAGARFVDFDFQDLRLNRTRMINSRSEDLLFLPGYTKYKVSEIVDENWANLAIIGMENPAIYSGLESTALNTIRKSRHQGWKYYFDSGINESKVHWCVVAGATRGWAHKLFPNLDQEESYRELWSHIFKITRSDSSDALERMKEHNRMLHVRMEKLNELGIRELNFLNNSTDLTVILSDRARFLGGSLKSVLGVEFEPNVPSEEVFTTPDYRGTNGYVRVTRPFLINGTLIEDLHVLFRDGLIVEFKCSKGGKMFEEYINSDEGARRLGEVALVGIDSPIYQSGTVFEEILFDENAACHIAVGSAYKYCIADCDKMDREQLEQIGFNESSAHTDMMISDKNTDVIATTDRGDVTLISNGEWKNL